MAAGASILVRCYVQTRVEDGVGSLEQTLKRLGSCFLFIFYSVLCLYLVQYYIFYIHLDSDYSRLYFARVITLLGSADIQGTAHSIIT